MPNRALRIGDAVTFREDAYPKLAREVRWLPRTWVKWNASGIRLVLAGQWMAGRTNKRRAFLASASNGEFVAAYALEIKLDDRQHRKREHDKIWDEKMRERAARQNRINRRKKS